MNKRILIASTALVASAFPALATTVTINLSFTQSADARLIEDSSGNAASGVYAFIGAFTSAPISSTSITDIASNFRQFSATSMGPTPQDGIDGFPGLATDFTDDYNTPGSNQANYDFSGLGIYVVIANVSDTANLSSATQLAVISDNDALSTWLFPTGNTPPPSQSINVLNDIDADDVIIGSLDSLTIGGDFAGTYSSIKLQAIPEPSSLALLGLGAVATLFRRRR